MITLNHWGRVTHICVSTLSITVSDNGLAPGRHQDIFGINDIDNLYLGTNVIEIFIEMYISSFKNVFENVVWKMAAILSRPQYVTRGSLDDSFTWISPFSSHWFVWFWEVFHCPSEHSKWGLFILWISLLCPIISCVSKWERWEVRCHPFKYVSKRLILGSYRF